MKMEFINNDALSPDNEYKKCDYVKKVVPNYFKIKYLTEEDRKKFAEMVIKLINIHEIKNFQIEEKRAFLKNKIYYNVHTLVTGNNFTFEELERNFLNYYEN